MILTGGSRTAAGLLAVALLAGCADTGSPEATASPEPIGAPATEPSAPEPSPSATPTASVPASEVDVTVVPDEITPEYVDAVANTLYGIIGEVTAEVLSQPADPANALSRDQLDRMADVADLDQYSTRVAELEELAQSSAAREGVVPADKFRGFGWRTVKLLRADESCVVAVGYVDLAGTSGAGEDDLLSALSLAPRRGSEAANPTPWLVVDRLVNLGPDGEPNPDKMMLEAEVSDFGDALQTTCRET